MLNILIAVDNVTNAALELIKNTDLTNSKEVSETSVTVKVSDDKSVFIDFEANGKEPVIWFTLWDTKSDEALDEQDAAELTEESIRYNVQLLLSEI